MNPVNDVKLTRGLGPVTAGTTNQACATVDMSGFESAIAILDVGTLTSTQVTGIKAGAGNKSDGSDAVDLAGTKLLFADADSNTCMITGIQFPLPGGYRYLTFTVLRGTANAVINGVWILQFGGHKRPMIQDTTVSHSAMIVEPAAGTP